MQTINQWFIFFGGKKIGEQLLSFSKSLHQQYISFLIIIINMMVITWPSHCMYQCLNISHLLITSTTVEIYSGVLRPILQQTFSQNIVKSKKILVKPKLVVCHHTVYMTVIELMPGTTPPHNQIYPLSLFVFMLLQGHCSTFLIQQGCHSASLFCWGPRSTSLLC